MVVVPINSVCNGCLIVPESEDLNCQLNNFLEQLALPASCFIYNLSHEIAKFYNLSVIREELF